MLNPKMVDGKGLAALAGTAAAARRSVLGDKSNVLNSTTSSVHACLIDGAINTALMCVDGTWDPKSAIHNSSINHNDSSQGKIDDGGKDH